MPPYPKERRGSGESLGHYLERLEQQRWTWEQQRMPIQWGEYLEQLGKQYPWDWFGTFTFSDPGVVPAGAHYWFRRYLAMAQGLTKPYAFRADEYGGVNGRLHLHALVGNVAHLTIFCGQALPPRHWGKACCWLHAWPCGYARILSYDSKLGARFYLSKYVAKQFGDYELLGLNDSLVFNSPKEANYGVC